MKWLFWGILLLIPLTDALSQATHSSLPDITSTDEVKAAVKRLLQSDAKKDQAWAAWLIGKYRLEEFTPALYGMLYGKEESIQGEEWHIILAAFDSLIQLDAAVPSEILMPLSNRFPNEVIILLAKTPMTNRRDLLSLLQKRLSDERWLAVCNLLAEWKAPGFAAVMLHELKIKASILVTQDLHYLGGFWGIIGGGGVSCGPLRILGGFPPLVFYDLRMYAQRGDVLVAPGRHPVFYSRQEISLEPDEQAWSGGSWSENDRDNYRAEYLTNLLGIPDEELNFKHRPRFTVVWKNNAGFKREVTRIRGQINQSWKSLVGRLVQEKLLSEKEAADLKPNITIEIRDERKNKSVKLPEVSEM